MLAQRLGWPWPHHIWRRGAGHQWACTQGERRRLGVGPDRACRRGGERLCPLYDRGRVACNNMPLLLIGNSVCPLFGTGLLLCRFDAIDAFFKPRHFHLELLEITIDNVSGHVVTSAVGVLALC